MTRLEMEVVRDTGVVRLVWSGHVHQKDVQQQVIEALDQQEGPGLDVAIRLGKDQLRIREAHVLEIRIVDVAGVPGEADRLLHMAWPDATGGWRWMDTLNNHFQWHVGPLTRDVTPPRADGGLSL